jgi:acetyl-CoA carboxylase biotin carboxyl carrier protein
MATKKDNGTKGTGNKKTVTQTQSEMQTTEIRDLIDFIAQSGLNEVDIETKELKLHVKREPDQRVMKSTPVAVVAQPQQQVVTTQQPVTQQQVSTKTEKPAATVTKGLEIKSPMIGTFYRTSNPDSPPFVSVGDKVTKGQTVCIIEAMKLFNEIESEVSGTIVKAMVENASPVEYDQVLFVVEPD